MQEKNTFHMRSLLISIPVGVAAVSLFSFLSGHSFATGPFPVLAILLGFTLTGMIVGYMSEGETILEPGLASIAVACITYFLIPAMGRGYTDMVPEEDLLVMMNGVLFTFVGALVGEQLQGTLDDGLDQKQIDWSWVFAGCMVGITIAFTVVSILSFFMGYQEWVHFVAFAIGLLSTGFIVGRRSAGKTIWEAALAGLITVIICTDFVFIALVTFDSSYIVLGLLLGVVASLVGGIIGEKMQSSKA